MKRAVGLALLLAASLANAQTRHAAASPAAPNVVGTVSSVSGHIIKVANGMIAIDASAAAIVDTANAALSLASVTPGSLIIATVKSDGIAANAPIPATRIVSTAKSVDVTLTGPLTAVDVAYHTLTILGKTLQVTPQTIFYGPAYDTLTRGLADLQPNQLAIVQVSGTQSLDVKSVLLIHVEHPK